MQKELINDMTTRLAALTVILDEDFREALSLAIALCIDTLKAGNTIFICGNGGSHAQALHFAAELTGRFLEGDEPKPCHVLGCNPSHITAVANDFGYEYIFTRELLGVAGENDLLIGLSTSGTSANVIDAIHHAKLNKLKTIGLFGPNKVNKCDIELNVETTSRTDIIQEVHLIIIHALARYISYAFKKGTEDNE